MKLRSYQKRVVEKSLDYLKGKDKSPSLVVSPTGSGKSLLISKTAKESGEPSLVLQPKKELLEQNLAKLRAFGGDATVYSASMNEKELSDFTYATLGSIKSMGKKFRSMGIKNVFIDEAHSGYPPETGSMFRNFMDDLKPDKVIGYTATPFRLKTSLGPEGTSISKLVMLNRSRPKYFKKFIDVVQIQEIVENGWWSDIQYVEHKFDDSSLLFNSSGAEFDKSSVIRLNEKLGVNNNIYLRVKELMKDPDKKILVFTDCVETAEKMTQHLPNTAYLHAKMSKKEREQVLNDFKSGKIRAVFNYAILAVGFDFPELNHVIMGRPTNSMAVYYQIVGRITRPHESKEFSVVEDFGGNVGRFGKVENLTIEDYPSYGWGVFSRDIILTGQPMDALKKRKSDIGKTKVGETVMWFGKHKDKKISELKKSYMIWLLEWMESLDSMSNKMEALQTELRASLNRDVMA